MRPWHVALLVLGAGFAGVLALEMSQPQPVPDADWRSAPPPVATVEPPQAVPAPPVTQPAKPWNRSAPAQPPVRTDQAPAAVFTSPPEPPAPKVIRKNKPNPFGEPLAESSPVKPFPGAVYVPDAPAVATPPVAATINKPAAASPAIPSGHERRHVTLEPGMMLAVRVNGPLPGCAIPNETFTGWLTEPVIINDLIIAERGARVSGRCGGRTSGNQAQVQLVLSRFMTADGQWVPIETAPWKPGAAAVAPTIFRISYPVTITERDFAK